jgi:predicted dehydrogenase
MGRQQASILSELEGYRLGAVCDLQPELAEACARDLGVRAYTDFGAMLAGETPDVVAVCTPNTSHCRLTLQAAEAGVRGIYCEKPMAVNLRDAREMVAACEARGVRLVINHQRRLGGDLVQARRLIESGAIGDVLSWRGYCAGDVLSDGSHVVDSLLALAGDPVIRSVAGQVHRDVTVGPATAERPGFRYGHPVESAGWGMLVLEDGRRIEVFCGDYRGRTAYQEYEVRGTHGSIWRVGDGLRPNLFIQDRRGGPLESVFDPQVWHARPVPAAGGSGLWRAVEDAVAGRAIDEGYRRLARWIHHDEPHPMDGRTALRGFECLMAIYESARLGRRVDLPLAQERFPLELMMEEGRA